MKMLTIQQFAEYLKNREIEGKTSAEFSLIRTKTSPKLNKTNRNTGDPIPYKSVSKHTRSFCSLNIIYSNAVNNKAVREGYQEKGENLFVAEPLPWGSWVTLPNGKTSKVLIEKAGDLYIRATFNTKIKPETTWIADGVEISKSDLIDYLPPDRENFVEVRTFKISSIQEIHLDHEIFQIIS